MTNRLENLPPRRLACSGCGSEFTCSQSGPCWCAEEVFRLPMPLDGGDCLCPDCLCPDCLRQKATLAASTVST